MGRSKSGDTAAFLIDHQHRASRQDAAQGEDQVAELPLRSGIAREQDHAAGWLGAKQRCLIVRQLQPRDANDGGFHAEARISEVAVRVILPPPLVGGG